MTASSSLWTKSLMALCDQLEAEVGDADGIRSRLLDSLLQESLASQEASIHGTVAGSARVGNDEYSEGLRIVGKHPASKAFGLLDAAL